MIELTAGGYPQLIVPAVMHFILNIEAPTLCWSALSMSSPAGWSSHGAGGLSSSRRAREARVHQMAKLPEPHEPQMHIGKCNFPNTLP